MMTDRQTNAITVKEEDFDIEFYMSNNKDVVYALGFGHYPSAFRHFQLRGMRDGLQWQLKRRILYGMDFAEVFASARRLDELTFVRKMPS